MNQGKQWILGAKGPNSEIKARRTDITTAATNFYEGLYTTNIKPAAHNDVNNQPNNDTIEVPPILQSVVRIAVEELKNGKTAGEDHIHNEYLKVGLEELQKPLTEMFNKQKIYQASGKQARSYYYINKAPKMK